jgi:hypothetical protein
MPQGLIQPANAILYAGEPEIQELEVKTATNLAPGRLVIQDTNAWDVKVAGAAALLVLGVADVMSDKKLTDMQTEIATGAPLETYSAGDQIRVLRGDIVVKCLAVSGATIAVGTRLIAAANGMVTAGTTAGAVIGYSLEAPTLTSLCKWVLVKLTI